MATFDPLKEGATPVQESGFNPQAYGATPIQEAQPQSQPLKASSGILSPFVSGLTALPQAIGQLAGNVLQQPTINGLRKTLDANSNTAQELLGRIQAETDPVRKEKLRADLRNLSSNSNELANMLNDLSSGEGVRQATAINIPGLLHAPALPSTDNKSLLGEVIAGRAIKQVATSAAPQLGITASFGGVGAGTAMEEGGSAADIAAKTALYAILGKFLGFGLTKIAGTEIGQRVIESPVGSTILKVGNTVFSPFLAQNAAPGTIGAEFDNAFKTFGKAVDTLYTPSVYFKAANKAFHAIGETIGIAKTEEQQIADAQGKITDYWDNVKGRYQTLVKYDKNSPEILGREGIIPTGKNGTMFTGDQAQLIKTKAASENSLFNKILEESQTYGSVDSAYSSMQTSIENNFQGLERQQALNTMDKQFTQLLKDHADEIVVGANGEPRLPLNVMNSMKSYMWSQGYASQLAPTSDQINASAMRSAGYGMKDYINTVIKTDLPTDVANTALELNDHSAELFQAEKFLNAVNGKKLPYGMIGRHFARVAGAVIGSHGGLPGSIAGTITADQLVTILQNPEISVGRSAQIIRDLQETNPQVVNDAYDILKNMQLEKSSRLLLPERTSSSIELPQSGVLKGQQNLRDIPPTEGTPASFASTNTEGGFSYARIQNRLNDIVGNANGYSRGYTPGSGSLMQTHPEIAQKILNSVGPEDNIQDIASLDSKIRESLTPLENALADGDIKRTLGDIGNTQGLINQFSLNSESSKVNGIPFVRGEGGLVDRMTGTSGGAENMFGPGTYGYTGDNAIKSASKFGVTKNYIANIKPEEIYQINSQEEYQNLIEAVIKKYGSKAAGSNPAKLIPKYLTSLGYKGVVGSPSFDPLAGINIFSSKLLKPIK